MRLICPNCGAQYEVEDSVIPNDGRDVQCSNCGHTWFQRPAHLDEGLAEELDQAMEQAASAPEPAADEAPPPAEERETAAAPRGLDPEVADVLREEAAHEAAARRGESGSLETQTELGLDEAGEQSSSRSAAARARMARLRGVDEGSPEAAAAALAAATGSRSDLLPDIEEINSSLTASQDRADMGDVSDGSEPEVVAEPKRRGFQRGFSLVVLVSAIALAIYVFAPEIVAALPQSEPYLTGYVAFVNDMRIQLAQGIDAALVQFWKLAGGAGAG